MKKKITKNSTLAEILEIPGSKEILERHKLPCLFCPLISLEMEALELGKLCQAYNIKEEKILKELQALSLKK